LLVIGLGIWVALRSVRRTLLLASVSAIVFLPWAMYHHAIYGTPLGPSTTQMSGTLWSNPFKASLAGVLVSPARGLFIWQPWAALAMLGLLMRRPGEPGASAPGAEPASDIQPD